MQSIKQFTNLTKILLANSNINYQILNRFNQSVEDYPKKERFNYALNFTFKIMRLISHHFKF